jgi:2-polyprenyl-3-methyl-5-hydroxy-6-metoxy-1,4-benzoquinol methylase/uncharacterized protein YbaR (Trm112 family)
MHFHSLKYVRCIHCKGTLTLESFKESEEIEEGILTCQDCHNRYPIVENVPIFWNSLASYLSNRQQLGGHLYVLSKNEKLKHFFKDSLRNTTKNSDDVTNLEKHWVSIYQNSTKSRFYTQIRKILGKLPRKDLALEHGCSIGNMTKNLAKNNNIVFGIDQSFFAILEAKKNKMKNLDYFVANSTNQPFGDEKFGLVLALNVLELIEPKDFLKVLSLHTYGTAIISDPYDYERGKNSVKERMNAEQVRAELQRLGFVLVNGKIPKFIPWKIRVNSRLSLNYKVDLIVAKKSKDSSRSTSAGTNHESF